MLQTHLGTIMGTGPLESLPILRDSQRSLRVSKILDLEFKTKLTDREVMAKVLDMESRAEIMGS